MGAGKEVGRQAQAWGCDGDVRGEDEGEEKGGSLVWENEVEGALPCLPLPPPALPPFYAAMENRDEMRSASFLGSQAGSLCLLLQEAGMPLGRHASL